MNRFKQLRKDSALSQVHLAEKLGVTQTAVSQWETGKSNPDIETLKKIALYYHVTIDFLLNTTAASEKIQNHVPIFSEIKGLSSFSSQENIICYESNKRLPSDGFYFGIKVCDHSMSPKYQIDDIVILLKDASISNNSDVLVQIHNEKAVLRKLILLNEGLLLQPLHPDYTPSFFSHKEKSSVQFLGVAQQLLRNL